MNYSIFNPLKAAFLIATVVFLQSCASTGKTPSDPYEDFNRSMWAFNKKADSYVLKPVAEGYKAVTPDPVEKGISNFFSNLSEIPTVINDLLQFKVGKAFHDTGRFLINSTLGLAGFLDPATEMGLARQPEDFGQTLATWGLDEGAYLMLPLFGPSTGRDLVGEVVDSVVLYSPYDELNDTQTMIFLRGLDLVQTRASLLGLQEQLDSSPDDYQMVRDVYLQRREFLINDGKVVVEDDECEFEEDCDDSWE